MSDISEFAEWEAQNHPLNLLSPASANMKTYNPEQNGSAEVWGDGGSSNEEEARVCELVAEEKRLYKLIAAAERTIRNADLVKMGRGNEGRVDSSLENNAPPSSQPRVLTPTGSASPTLSASKPFVAGSYDYDDLDAISVSGASDMSISSSLLEFAQDIHRSKESILEGFEVLDEEREFLEDILASAPLEEIELLRATLQDGSAASPESGISVNTKSSPISDMVNGFARTGPASNLLTPASGSWEVSELDLKESDLDAAIEVLEKARVLLKRKRGGIGGSTGEQRVQQLPATQKLGKRQRLEAISLSHSSTMSKTAMKKEAKRQRDRENAENLGATKPNLIGSEQWYKDSPASHGTVVDAEWGPNPSKEQLNKQKSAENSLKAPATAEKTSEGKMQAHAKEAESKALKTAEQKARRARKQAEKRRSKQGPQQSAHFPSAPQHISPTSKATDIEEVGVKPTPVDASKQSADMAPIPTTSGTASVPQTSQADIPSAVAQPSLISAQPAPNTGKSASKTPSQSKTERRKKKVKARKQRDSTKSAVRAGPIQSEPKTETQMRNSLLRDIALYQALDQARSVVRAKMAVTRIEENEQSAADDEKTAVGVAEAIAAKKQLKRERTRKRNKNRLSGADALPAESMQVGLEKPAVSTSLSLNGQASMAADIPIEKSAVETSEVMEGEKKKQKSARKPRKSKTAAVDVEALEQRASAVDSGSVVPLSEPQPPAVIDQVGAAQTPTKQKRGSRGRKSKNKHEESTPTTPASSQLLDCELLAILGDANPTKTNQGKKESRPVTPKKGLMEAVDFLDGNEDNIIIGNETELAAPQHDESYSSDPGDGIDGQIENEFSSAEMISEPDIHELLVDMEARIESTPKRTVKVVIFTPSKTWLAATGHEATADHDESVPVEPIVDENESAFSVSDFGSQDWDHSGDEFAAIKVSPKSNRRLSMSGLNPGVEPLVEGIPPPYRRRGSSATSGSSCKKRSQPAFRDAQRRFSSSKVEDNEDAEMPCTESLRKQQGSPVARKDTPEKNPIRGNRDSSGRFIKKQKAVATDVNVDVPILELDEKSAACQSLQDEAWAAHMEELELEKTSTAKINEFEKLLSKANSKKKRLPTKSPYFTPPVSPVKKDPSEIANKKCAGSSSKNSSKTRNSSNTKLEDFADLDYDETSENIKPRSPGGLVSCIPFPPLSAPHFGLIQENLAHDPFRLLIAVTFLIRTHGKHAIPVFYELMGTYPTPESLAEADKDEIVPIIRHLGLQNQRASTYQMYAKIWLDNPPVKGKRYAVRGYPTKSSGRDIKKDEILSDSDEREAWEIGHMTQGPYAIDSWRIFCRDVLRGVADSWNGEGSKEEGFQPEWMRVLPEDKELRAYLRWMWLKEGFEWDPFTGEKEVASPLLMRAAIEGRIAWDERGGMRILDEPMELEAGLSQVGNL